MVILYRCWLPVPLLAWELSVAVRSVATAKGLDNKMRVGVTLDVMLIFMLQSSERFWCCFELMR
jgi:hypothetical protein